MFFVEYCHRSKLGGGVDYGDAPWERYRPAFASRERADNEALWLSLDDGQYIYRIVEVTND